MSQTEIPIGILSHYGLLSLLSTTLNSHLYLARDELTSSLCAVKVYPRRSLSLEFETQTLQRLANQPNIVRLLEVEKNAEMKDEKGKGRRADYVALEYCQKGDLMEIVLGNKALGERIVRKWFREVMMAVEVCHRKGIAHLDIKLENILLSDSYSAILCDFGCASLSPYEPLYSPRGTSSHQPPEMIEGIYCEAFPADIFEAGVMLFCMMLRQPPFAIASLSCSRYHLFIDNPHVYWASLSSCSPNLSPDFISLITSMLHPDPARRPLAHEVLTYRWLSGPDATIDEIQAVINH